MALSEFDTALAEVHLDEYIEAKRPPVDIRDEVDLAYRVENQSVIVFEIRPAFRDKSRKIDEMIAKATYVKRANEWRIYWQRADLKWHAYEPNPTVQTLGEFLDILEDDQYGCFWG